MKAPEKLVQLHYEAWIDSPEVITRIGEIAVHASLTADVAVSFAIWLVAMPDDFAQSKGLTSHKELFDYFINNIYKHE